MCTEAAPNLENSTSASEKARSNGPSGNSIGVLSPSWLLLHHETGVKEEFSWKSVSLHLVTLELERSHSDGF